MAKGAALLMALGKPKGGSEMDPPEGESDGMGGAKMTAAEDALAAFKSGDASALSDALTRHYDACAMGGGYEDEE